MIDLMLADERTVHACISGNHRFNMPLCNIPDTDQWIVAFDSMGKRRLIEAIAEDFVKNFDFSEADILICPEAKAIPIAQEISRLLCIDYYVLRKNKKLYMEEPRSLDVSSITTKEKQDLWYDWVGADRNLAGKNVILFDDVVSTGSSFKALVQFAKALNLNVVGQYTVFLEGKSLGRKDINSLGSLPIITTEDISKKVGKLL